MNYHHESTSTFQLTLFLPDVIGAAGKWKAAGAHAKRAVRKGKQEDGEGAKVTKCFVFFGVAPMILKPTLDPVDFLYLAKQFL